MAAKPKVPSRWSQLLVAERNIVRLFFILPILYFLAQLFLQFVLNFMGGQGFTRESTRAFFSAIDTVWRWHIGGYFIFWIITMAFITIISLIKGWAYRPPLALYPKPTILAQAQARKPKRDPELLKHWGALVVRANTGTQESMRAAVIEADALVDHLLKDRGYDGEHLAERLSKLRKGQVKSLEGVWQAHRLRNELVHTPGTKISARQTEKALFAYRDFFKEMGAF